MINAHVHKNSAVPWWAAFGAPLVGVPLLVVLLALGAPKKAKSDSANVDKAYVTTTTEQVGVRTTSTAAELPPAYKEDQALPRC